MEQRAAYRKFHFIYKTTCLITKKCYYGMHSTDDLNDGYLGSGKIIRASLKKHGRENHSRVILEMLPDRESLCAREEELLDEGKLKDPTCMNLYPGGQGAGAKPGHETSPETRAKLSVAVSGEKNGMWGKPGPNLGKIFSEETRRKMAESMKGNTNYIRKIRRHERADGFDLWVGSNSISMTGEEYDTVWIGWLRGEIQSDPLIDQWASGLRLSVEMFYRASIKWQDTHRPDWRTEF